MPLRRISTQGREDLYQTFRRDAQDLASGRSQINRMMLELLPKLEELCAPIEVWALTSHNRLVLLTHDDYTTPWYVIIDTIPSAYVSYRVPYFKKQEDAPLPDTIVKANSTSVDEAWSYCVRYLMSEKDAHWPHAVVEAMATSADDACRLILRSMQRTGAWDGLLVPPTAE